MTKVISNEFQYHFDTDIENADRPLSVSGVATVSYVAEQYSKSDPWYIEELNISDMTLEEIYSGEDETTVNADELVLIAEHLMDQRSGILYEKALDDAREVAFFG